MIAGAPKPSATSMTARMKSRARWRTAASGLVSLAKGAARLLAAAPVTQTILEMAGGYLFVTTIDHGAALAVHADRNCDMGMIGYEMTMLANRAGHALSPGVRSGSGR